jgi:hypothetical protein
MDNLYIKVVLYNNINNMMNYATQNLSEIIETDTAFEALVGNEIHRYKKPYAND